MAEKQFEPDCAEDCHNNQYDYSILNSRYEANPERNEIIEWNKDSCNAKYVGLERIAEKLNFKQMKLEECRKGYEKLCEENEQLKEHIKSLEKQLYLIHMQSMFSTVKSFKGDVSKRYKYSEETDTIYDTANKYGQFNKILDKKEIAMLLNEYETILKELEE